METYKTWIPEKEPLGVVQILHGMAEHIGRYERLAKTLNTEGFAVCGRNHRGHGPEAELPGYFADQNGWDAILSDARSVSLDMKKLYPGLPFFLLGHSMGSFLAREYALRWGNEITGLILSGTGSFDKAACLFGQALARMSPGKKPAKLVDKIAFSGNNRPFSPGRTGYEWLSRDEKEVDQYVADPLCGFRFTGSAFADFFGGLNALSDESRLQRMPKGLPVLFLSGDQDPVGQMGKGVKKTAESFQKAGMTNMRVKLYPGARHEVFNETNRDEVTKDLINWLKDVTISC